MAKGDWKRTKEFLDLQQLAERSVHGTQHGCTEVLNLLPCRCGSKKGRHRFTTLSSGG